MTVAEPGPAPTIGSVLREPDVARTLGASVVARLAFGALALLIVLHLTSGGHSYGEAGIAAGAYSVALAFCSPALSRLIDRTGQTRVLLATALTGTLSIALLGLLPADSSLGVLIAVSALAGLSQPPLGGVMRALWDLLVTDERARHIGFSLEAVAVETVFTAGPLVIVGGVAAAFGSSAALLVCAVLTGLGTLTIAASGPSRRWRPDAGRHIDLLGPLRSPGVRTLMIVGAGMGIAFSAIEIGITAFAREEGSEWLIGVLLALWSIGSLLGGLASTRLAPAQNPARRIVLFLGWIALGNLAVGLSGNVWILTPLLMIAGAAIAPVFATANGAVGRVAPMGTITEALAWTTGAVMVGATVGSPVAGFLIDHVSIAAAISFSGCGPALAAGLVLLRHRTLDPVH